MQPPNRDFAPDPDFNGPPPPISPSPSPVPLSPPSVFDAAPAPAAASLSSPIAPFNEFATLDSSVGGGGAPIAPPFAPPALPGNFSHRVARWRWAMSLLLIGFYPAFVALLGKLRPRHGSSGPALPSSVRGLIIFSVLELGVFGIFWALGWAFSRATKDELLLRWRGGFKPILQGFGYAFALRLGLMVIIVFVAGLVLTITGIDPKQFAQFMKQNQPQTDSLFPKGAMDNPLYLLFMTTVLSFVVAGVREELWRTSALAALRHLLPDRWSDTARWITAIGLSSVVFGLGHLYQGGLGVVLTGLLGAGLGAVTWRHRSIWPSVFAHGFIDATSFLAAAVMASKKIAILSLWFGG